MKLYELWQRVTHAGQTASENSPVRILDQGGNEYEFEKIVADRVSGTVIIWIKDK